MMRPLLHSTVHGTYNGLELKRTDTVGGLLLSLSE